MARTRARRAVEREDQKSVSAYTRNRLLIFAAAQVLVVALGVFVQFRLPQQAGTRSPEPSPCGLLGNRTRYFVFSRRVVTPRGTFPATVGVDGGRIVSVDKGRREDLEASDLVLDYGDLVVSPGLVDLHVHVNEPGRESWEGFSTATAAAAAGG